MPMQFRSDDTSYWPYKFGSGADGVATWSSNGTWSPIRASCSGLSGSTSLNISAVSGTFTNGELVMIHQSRGTGAGNWELAKISSGGGTSTLTLQHALSNTYTDSGASQAQVTKLYQYSSATVNSGVTLSSTAWDGNTGGIICFCVNGTLTISGTISASEKGYRGGTRGWQFGLNNAGGQGEGTSGDRNTQSTAANGNGGGAGGGANPVNAGGAPAGGGGNGASGETGYDPSRNATKGTGGSTGGVSALTSMVFGGGGGGGGCGDANPTQSATFGYGQAGGGIILIMAKTVSITGSVVANGGTHALVAVEDQHAGGAGGGGSVLIKAISATLGTAKITASGGARCYKDDYPNDVYYGGAGGVGRVHLDYLYSYSGTTSPTLDVRQDFSLRLGQSTGGVI